MKKSQDNLNLIIKDLKDIHSSKNIPNNYKAEMLDRVILRIDTISKQLKQFTTVN